MANLSLYITLCFLVGAALSQRGGGPHPKLREQVDPGFGRPAPPVDPGYDHPPPIQHTRMGGGPPPMNGGGPPDELGQFVGPLMRHVAGAVMDFIGAEMYGDRVFKKMTTMLTTQEYPKYKACADAAMTKIKQKEEEYAPDERKMLLDEVLGKCMLKTKYNWNDEQVDKLECCTVKRYFHSMMSWGSRRKNGIPTPPGFRMVEAEFDCMMTLAYGFTNAELKTMRTCAQKKIGLNSEADLEEKYKQLLGSVANDQVGLSQDRPPKLPTQEDIKACILEAKPSFNSNTANDIAFLNTKKRELAAQDAAKVSKVETVKRLLAILEKET